MSTPRALVCKRGHSRDPNDPTSELRLATDGRYDCIPCRRITDRARYLRLHPDAGKPRDRIPALDLYEDWLALQPISRAAFALRIGKSRDVVDQAIRRAQQRLHDLSQEIPSTESGQRLRGASQ